MGGGGHHPSSLRSNPRYAPASPTPGTSKARACADCACLHKYIKHTRTPLAQSRSCFAVCERSRPPAHSAHMPPITWPRTHFLSLSLSLSSLGYPRRRGQTTRSCPSHHDANRASSHQTRGHHSCRSPPRWYRHVGRGRMHCCVMPPSHFPSGHANDAGRAGLFVAKLQRDALSRHHYHHHHYRLALRPPACQRPPIIVVVPPACPAFSADMQADWRSRTAA